MDNQIDHLHVAEWRAIAHRLWDILDNIDTLSDAMKPERTPYYDAVMRYADQRHQLLVSDGYDLTPAEGIDFQPGEGAESNVMQRNATPIHVGIDLARHEAGLPPA